MNQLARVSPQPEIPPWENESEDRSASKRRRRFSLSRSRLPYVLALLLMVYLAVTIGGQIGTIAHLQREVQAIEADIAELKRKNEVLLNDLRNVKSEYYVDKSARENLGLVRAGETRVIFTPERASGTGQ